MEHALIELAAIVVLGVGALWLAWRLKLPSILLLLTFGFLAGPVTGLLNPDSLLGSVLMPFVSLSVAIILFEGGLGLNVRDLPKLGQIIRNLVTVGALATFAIATGAAILIFEMPLPLAVLQGAILVVTGPTVVIPLLRHIRPKGELGAILRWEGIVIDPVGATLAVLVFEVILAAGIQATALVFVSVILKTLLIGIFIGVSAAAFLTILMKHYWIPDYLDNAVSLMFVVGSFALSNHLQEESGFLTVTVMGIALANQRSVEIDHIIEFKENLQVLLLSALFILLAARVNLDHLSALNWVTVPLFLAVLILVGRPVAVFLSTLGSHLAWKERLFLAWMAPRGIVAASVAAIFALRLGESGVKGAEQLVPITFIVIVGTILVYGFTAMPLGKWLQVVRPDPQGVLIVGGHRWALAIGKILHECGLTVLLADANWKNVSRARMEGLQTYFGNILSRRAMEEVELDGIGKLVALTGNDEVNALCVLHFEELFGRASVFQLPLSSSKKTAHETLSETLHGRILFDSSLDFDRFETLIDEGGEVRSTTITTEFPFTRFQQGLPPGAYPLFVVKPAGSLKPVVSGEKLEAEPGDRIVTLYPEKRGT